MYAIRKIEEWKFQAPWRKENAEQVEQAEPEFNFENEELSDAAKQMEQQQLQEAHERLILEARLQYRMF